MSINESDVLLTKKSAFISIIGRPNVGKSSLLNTLVGEKIAIVSKKPQTTRNRIMGVLTRDNTQLIFIDTPGFHKAKTKLGDYMVKSVKTTVSDVDVAVLVIDASREKVGKTEENLINSIKAANIPAIAVLNKIDLLEDKTKLMPLISELSQMYDFRAIIPISVKTGSGIKLLMTIASAGPLPT
ncbi:MAG: GTPase Era, partial [Clostridia bacterium]|nr:GTPase Era [Clostridia bacterium]